MTKYTAGDIVIVAPGSAPKNGDLVIAKFRNDDVTFKIYHLSRGKIKLTAYNPVFPETSHEPEEFA